MNEDIFEIVPNVVFTPKGNYIDGMIIRSKKRKHPINFSSVDITINGDKVGEVIDFDIYVNTDYVEQKMEEQSLEKHK